jgi:hypothetical protein
MKNRSKLPYPTGFLLLSGQGFRQMVVQPDAFINALFSCMVKKIPPFTTRRCRMDPITSAIVSALSAQVPVVVKDAYDALKAAIGKKFGKASKVAEAVVAVEKEPEFKPNREALAGRLAQVQAVSDSDLLKLTEALVEALKKSEEGRAALSKYNVTIADSDVGVIGDHTHIEGGLHFGKK